LYAPEIRKNLVYGSFLIQHGFRIVFEAGKVILTKNGHYVGRGYVTDGMFKINVMVVDTNVAIATVANEKVMNSAYLLESFNLWHGRLGHVNSDTLRKLINLKCLPTFHMIPRTNVKRVLKQS
jgi:hypothetical protein